MLLLLLTGTLRGIPVVALSGSEEEELRGQYRQSTAEGISRILTWLEFSMNFALGDDRNDYFSLAAKDTIETAVQATARRTLEANRVFFQEFKAQFGNLDREMIFHGYERLAIEGRLPWHEMRDMLGLHWIEARMTAEADDPFPLLAASVTVLNFCLAAPSRRGVEGLRFMDKVVTLQFPFLARALTGWQESDGARERLRNYYLYFAATLFDLPTMYRYEQLQLLGRILPEFEPECARAWLPGRPLHDAFPALRDHSRYWLFQETDSINNLYRIQSQEPYPIRMRRFRSTDKLRAANPNVNTWILPQSFVSRRASSAQARLRLLALALDCQRYRQARGRWPIDARELAAGGFTVPQDPFLERGNLVVTQTSPGLRLLSVGPDGQAADGAGDDLFLTLP